MQKHTVLPLLFCLFSMAAFAQEKMLTIEDATHMNPKLNAASLSQLQWIPGTRNFAYVANNAIVRGIAGNPKRDTLVRLRELNMVLGFNRIDTLKRFPAVTFANENQFYFISSNRLCLTDMLNNTVEVKNSWDKKAANTDLAKPSYRMAYTIDNNLFIADNGKVITVSDEKNPGIVYGSERVHRNEFGIDKGTFWSPTGEHLAFYCMDETMVTDYPLVDVSQRIATVAPTKYPMAGMASHKVTVGIYSLASGKIIYLQTRDRMKTLLPTGLSGDTAGADSIEYLTNVTWSPDEKHLYVAVLNRAQDHMQLNKYDAQTGALVKTLFEERNNRYVEPLHGPWFIGTDPGRFIWQSRRNGFNHLYLYDSEGNPLKQLTDGPWEVSQIVKADKAGTKVFFMANREDPIGSQLYSVDLKKGEIRLLTGETGVHFAQVCDDGKFIIDNYNNLSKAREIQLLGETGLTAEVLLTAGNPLKDYRLGETSIFTIPAGDRTPLYCRLIKPVDFDSTKKYPVIIYVYGGPHSQLVTRSWLGGGGLFLNYLASKGYVVFTLDNRGTAARGAEFEQVIHRNLGVAELADQMAGVRFLKQLPYVDSTRIGVNGWSYGGFMTITMMLKNPGTFKVAVCGGPVTDWQYYEVMYGERYMDTPQENPDGYKNACLMNHAGNLTGKLLIIHDDQDGTVVPQNSLVFLKKCVDLGKQVDFFLYPGHEHNVRGKDRIHLNQKMVQYFQDYL
jgi:dipeptidyl-peptidase-4